MLEITDIRKSFDGMNDACNQVNFYILEVRLFGFVDHNGTMKPPLLKWVDYYLMMDDID